jgi:starch synthase
VNILQVSAEIFPLLKTGGLADIAGAMPSALHKAGCDVRVLLPGFSVIRAGLTESQVVGRFTTPWGEVVEIAYGFLPDCSHASLMLGAYVLIAPGLYEREGGPYEDAHKHPYADNHRRFAALAWAAAHIAYGMDSFWKPQVVHCHDWHAALVPACLKLWPDGRATRVPSIYTVHNLAYQGLFDPACFSDLGLPAHAMGLEGMEFFGKISFMKAGLFFADHITTVSPTYAREIQTTELGCGLDGLLRTRSADLTGILNAVDDDVWNPATDANIEHLYDVRRMKGKALNKIALQKELGLDADPEAPLFAVVSRLTEQKGLPLVLAGVDDIAEKGGQLVVLGNGDSHLEHAFSQKAQTRAGIVAVRLGYNEALAHKIFAGSDFTLVPSSFEPCGLTQMYGLKYGSVPLVRRVGGLADTVVDADLATLAEKTATGIVFDDFTFADYRHALLRAFALYRQQTAWRQVRATGMRTAQDWSVAAERYTALYRRVV